MCAFFTLINVVVASYVTISGFFIWQANHRVLNDEASKIPNKVSEAIAQYILPYKEQLDKEQPTTNNVTPIRKSNDELINDENEAKLDGWLGEW